MGNQSFTKKKSQENRLRFPHGITHDAETMIKKVLKINILHNKSKNYGVASKCADPLFSEGKV